MYHRLAIVEYCFILFQSGSIAEYCGGWIKSIAVHRNKLDE